MTFALNRVNEFPIVSSWNGWRGWLLYLELHPIVEGVVVINAIVLGVGDSGNVTFFGGSF